MAAVAVLLGPLIAPLLLLAQFRAAYLQHSQQIDEQMLTFARLQALAGQSDEVDRWAATLAQGLDRSALVMGASASLVAAELQSRLVALGMQAGVQMTSFQALQPVAKDELVDVGVEISAQGSLAAVCVLLEAVEYATPLLFVKQAQFRAQQGGAAGELMLTVQLEIHGFWQPIGAPQVASSTP